VSAPIRDHRAPARELHLDEPIPVQFAHYLWGVVRGDLAGPTSRSARSSAISPTLSKTLQLAGAAMLLAVTCGIPLASRGDPARGWMIVAACSSRTSASRSRSTGWAPADPALRGGVSWLPPSGYGGMAFLVLRADLGTRSIAFLRA